MADQYTPEEIAGIFEAYNNAIKSGTPITQEMADAMKDAQKGVKGFAAAQRNLFQALGKSVADVSKAMYRGEQGAKGLADSVETVTTALTTLSFLIGGPLVKAISLVTMGLFKLGKVSAEQSDQLFKTYQDLARTGAGAADGMKGVFDNMQKFGYGLEQLDQMTALIKENSKTLSTFGGTVLGGTKIFADSMAGIQRSDIGRQLQRMGYTVDDINKYGAGYVKLQQMLGQTQTSIQRGLTEGTIKYTMELDKLARITGDTREAQEAKIAEAMAEDTFAATMDELREQAAAGDASAEARLKKLTILNQTLTGEARQEFIKAIGGDVAAAQKLMMTAPQAYQMMLDSSSSAGDVMRTLVAEEKNTRRAFRGLYQLGAAGDTFFRYSEQQERAAKFGEKNLDQQLEQAAVEQTVTDQTTKNAADLRISQQQARDALQSFVNIGVAPATAALKGLSGAAAGVAKMAPGTVATGQAIGGGTANVGAAMDKSKEKLEPIKPSGPASQSQKEFLDSMYKTLLDEAKKQGVKNPEVIARLGTAQSALETGYGRSTAGGNNYFGIKARPGEGGPGMATKEFIDGKWVTINDRFRKYGSMQESASDYIKFLKENKRYQGVLGAGSLEEAIAAQARTGYATDPRYGEKLTSIAGKMVGPASGYDNKMASVKPTATLPERTEPATTTTTTASTDSDKLLSSLTSALQAIDRKMSDVADNTKKTAQHAAV